MHILRHDVLFAKKEVLFRMLPVVCTSLQLRCVHHPSGVAFDDTGRPWRGLTEMRFLTLAIDYIVAPEKPCFLNPRQ